MLEVGTSVAVRGTWGRWGRVTAVGPFGICVVWPGGPADGYV